MEKRSGEDLLDLQLLDAVTGLFARLITESEALARRFGVPPFVIKALHMLDAPLAMKELGQRMRCDPSFITSIADMLEQRGLAVRESSPDDRRVKRLVLTPAGEELKHRVESELAARMPWRSALSHTEQSCLLELVRKMTVPLRAGGATAPGATAEEVSTLLTATATSRLADSPRARRPAS